LPASFEASVADLDNLVRQGNIPANQYIGVIGAGRWLSGCIDRFRHVVGLAVTS
jgi:hypothetical protein